jgi:nucleosome binding factor SPN SPT16 subunit
VKTRKIKAADVLPQDNIIERNKKGEIIAQVHVSEIERRHCSMNGIHVNGRYCFEPYADIEVEI